MVQERHRPGAPAPESGHENHQRFGTPVLCIKAERVGGLADIANFILSNLNGAVFWV